MKKSKLWIIGLSFLLLVTFSVYRILKEKNTIFGIDTINETEIESIKNGRSLNDDIKIYYNDKPLPNIDSASRYLLSQSNREVYNGKLSCDKGYEIKVLKSNKEKHELMEENEPLKAIVYSENSYKLIDIIMTNMPVVSLDDERYEYYNFDDGTEYQLAYADMVLYDPIANGSDIVDIIESGCKYRIRGATSRVYPKQSFKLNLLDKDGEAKERSLLNMRKDNDWILNAMYIEESKVKEYIGYDIWNKLNANSTPNVQYVELIINGSYRGIYLLQSPVDHKTFNSKKSEDILFSVNNRGYEVEERYLFNDDVDFENETNVDEFELEKEEYIDNRIGFELVRKLYSDIFNLDYQSQYNIEYDVDNFAKYALFLNLIEATDNSYKNQKIIFKQRNKYDYMFEKEAWDLDISMLESSYGEVDVNSIVEDVLLPIEVKENPRYQDLQCYYYKKIRTSYYNREHIDELMQHLYNYLMNGSAIQRDMIRWNYTNFEESIMEVRAFLNQRISVLDKHYGEVE